MGKGRIFNKDYLRPGPFLGDVNVFYLGWPRFGRYAARRRDDRFDADRIVDALRASGALRGCWNDRTCCLVIRRCVFDKGKELGDVLGGG